MASVKNSVASPIGQPKPSLETLLRNAMSKAPKNPLATDGFDKPPVQNKGQGPSKEEFQKTNQLIKISGGTPIIK